MVSIVEERKWKELLKPNIYKAVIHLYQLNNEEINIFGEIINNYYYRFGKMFTIWTISAFFNEVMIGPIISAFMIFYRNTNGNMIIKLCMILISAIVGYFTGSFFLTSLICQFGYHVFFNSVTIAIVKNIINETVKQIN